jgi:hypothetical protein
MEDSLQECTQKKYDISNLIKKYRAKASGDSGILRLYINQFIAGGAKNETWVTPSRKENSNYGGINKSIISEEYGKLLYNLRKITH